MTWRQRLRRLDERSGFAQWQLDAIEFTAPLNALGVILFGALSIKQAHEEQWDRALFFAVGAVSLALVTLAGYRRRRRRDRQEDRWQPL